MRTSDIGGFDVETTSRRNANGGDNIAAYTAVFRTSSAGDIAVMLGVFAVGVILWCATGSWLVSHRRIAHAIQRWGHWIVPAVFSAIGVYIFYKAGVFGPRSHAP